jgi:Tol biopolymer transport system component
MVYLRRTPVSVEATRFVVLPPEGWSLAAQLQAAVSAGPLAVSPDGRQVAFVARNASGGNLIWVRSLDTLAAKGLAGTEEGTSPFWSPDSRSLGFFAAGKLRRIDISGGPPVTLCDAAPGISGTWSPQGVIVFSPAGGTVLQKVSASGGIPTAVTAFQGDETGHARPAFLPDGRHFVYRAIPRPDNPIGPVFVGSLDSTAGVRVMDDIVSTNVVYSQGHLLFLRETTLMAQPFDPDRLVLSGEPFPVAEQIQTFVSYGFFAASHSGVLAYQTGTAGPGPQLAWLDRTGTVLGTVGAPVLNANLALAPDGRQAMVTRLGDLWLLDLVRDGLATRFTFDAALDTNPVWSPAGDRIVFSSARNSSVDLYQKAASGAGVEEVLLATTKDEIATSWSADGRYLLYNEGPPPNDIWALPMSGDKKPFPVLQTQANETQGQFSPDGKWIAYVSNESGRGEVYVAPFKGSSASGGKWQVSTSGGNQPRWRPDGKEILYVSPSPNTQLMAATVSAEGETFTVGVVTSLFRVRLPNTGGSFYQVGPDGNRLLFNLAPEGPAAPAPITVVLNWTAALKK